ncbi:MAG: RNA polymerase sigma factor, partial [Chloroflexota bacterium]
MTSELVERAQRGDHEAFDVLATAAYGRLYGIARRILRDRYAAEDAVQEALVRAWRNLWGLRDPDAFDAWLHRL